VKPGEEVIVDGIQKAKQGGEVRTKQYKLPDKETDLWPNSSLGAQS